MAVTKKSLTSSSPVTSKISRAKGATPATGSVNTGKVQTAHILTASKLKAGARVLPNKHIASKQVKTAVKMMNF